MKISMFSISLAPLCGESTSDWCIHKGPPHKGPVTQSFDNFKYLVNSLYEVLFDTNGHQSWGHIVQCAVFVGQIEAIS